MTVQVDMLVEIANINERATMLDQLNRLGFKVSHEVLVTLYMGTCNIQNS